MIVKSKSGRECVEYHGSLIETERKHDAMIHLWITDRGGQEHDMFASTDVVECARLNDALLTAYGAGTRVFSVATWVEKTAREKPADVTINATGENVKAPAVHR